MHTSAWLCTKSGKVMICLCGPLRISAISALKGYFSAEIAEIRRDFLIDFFRRSNGKCRPSRTRRYGAARCLTFIQFRALPVRH
jgi:hypothetical protein